MYDLNQAKHDFPWTRMSEREAIEWGMEEAIPEDGSPMGWFDDMLPGWGDIIHDGLTKIDAILKEDGCDVRIVVEQVKEKWGTLRFYVALMHDDGENAYDTACARRIHDIIYDMEEATGKVCCFCGRKDGLKWRRGWVHVSCDECEDEHVRR